MQQDLKGKVTACRVACEEDIVGYSTSEENFKASNRLTQRSGEVVIRDPACKRGGG